MTVRWMLAAFHLLALGVGLGSVWARARALRAPLDSPGAFNRVFYADSLWGIAALIWIATGVARAFGGFEKGTAYYMQNGFFLAKMALLLMILCLEVWPMVIRWRLALRRGERVRTDRASSMAWISRIEAVLVILMVFAATAMARGLGAGAVG